MDNEKLNKHKLKTFDNSKNRDIEHRQKYQLSSDFVQNYEIDRVINELSVDEAIELLTSFNDEALEFLRKYEQDPENIENIQNIRNLHYNIYFSLFNRVGYAYQGIKPYKVYDIDSDQRFFINELFDMLSSPENNVISTESKDFVEELKKNITSLKEISEKYFDKEVSPFGTEDIDYMTPIENDVNEDEKKSLEESITNKPKNTNFDYDNNRGERRKYAMKKNKELGIESEIKAKEKKKVAFVDDVNSDEIKYITIAEPSEKLNLDKKPTKSTLKQLK